MPELRLISDGKPGGTRIVDIETGERVKRVKSFKYEWSHREFARLTVEVVIADHVFPLAVKDACGDSEADVPTKVAVYENTDVSTNSRCGF